MLAVVEVVGAAAVVADFVCADAVAVWSWEDVVAVLACGAVGVLLCVAVGVLLVVLAVAPSARLEAVWLRLLATLAVAPDPHPANANMERPSTDARKAERVPILPP